MDSLLKICSRKGGNSKKFNFTLYSNYVFYAEISTDLMLTQFLIFFLSFLAPFLSIAKRPIIIFRPPRGKAVQTILVHHSIKNWSGNHVEIETFKYVK